MSQVARAQSVAYFTSIMPSKKKAKQYVIVLVTAPNVKAARKLAGSVLVARLAACANLVPRIESHYWWKGHIETGSEILILFKTSRARLVFLEKHVLREHSYETPEFLVLDISGGNPRYLDWLGQSIGEG